MQQAKKHFSFSLSASRNLQEISIGNLLFEGLTNVSIHMVFVEQFYNNYKCKHANTSQTHTANLLSFWKRKRPFLFVFVFFAFKMLPLISPQCCLSSQLPPCQPALLLPLPCSSRYSSQAKPQLSHMPCLLDVWTKLGGSEAKTAFLSESDPVRRDGWKCLPLWFPGEQRRKTNGVWLPYFLKVLDVTCRYCGTRVGALTLAAWLPSCPAVCQADTMERAPEPSPLPHPHSIPAADYSTACSVALLTTQSACSHGDDPVSNWSIEVGRHRLVWLCRRWWLIACSSCGWHPWLFQDKYEIIRKKTDFLKEIEIANE